MGALSAEKTQTQIDYWVDRYDPTALRRTEYSARGCHIDVRDPQDGSGTAWVEGRLVVTDAEALDQRLDAIAQSVCDKDPRTLEQRRSAALGALAHHADRLVCLCEDPDCDAKDATPSAVVVHVIAHEESLTDDTPAQLDGAEPVDPSRKPWQLMTWRELLAPRPPEPQVIAATPPAAILGGGLLPAPLLAAKVAGVAKIVPIVHPGDAPPQPRYTPSAALATFVRCRDMTCRFPGCDEPAHRCDIHHTIAYPRGPTQASNLKTLCRKHHLLKTFWGWHDRQEPDGTVTWTSPDGQNYTTHPGSRLLFPTLCRPTAPTRVPETPDTSTRTLAMPRRATTRTQNRAQAINDERRYNEHAIQLEAEEVDRERHATPREPSADPAPF